MTSDIIIRAACPDDAEGLVAMQALPGFRSGTLRLPFPSVSAVRNWLQTASEEKTILIAQKDGLIVGNSSFTHESGRRSHVGSLAIGVHDDHAGVGIGTALMQSMMDLADNWLNLRRIELSVFVDNEPAIRLYSKFGFEREGVIRDFAFRNGQFIDAFAMARLNRPS